MASSAKGFYGCNNPSIECSIFLSDKQIERNFPIFQVACCSRGEISTSRTISMVFQHDVINDSKCTFNINARQHRRHPPSVRLNRFLRFSYTSSHPSVSMKLLLNVSRQLESFSELSHKNDRIESFPFIESTLSTWYLRLRCDASIFHDRSCKLKGNFNASAVTHTNNFKADRAAPAPLTSRN